MHVGDTLIVDTFAEAFRLRFARLVVTALDDHWLSAAIASVCGYGTSATPAGPAAGASASAAGGPTIAATTPAITTRRAGTRSGRGTIQSRSESMGDPQRCGRATVAAPAPPPKS